MNNTLASVSIPPLALDTGWRGASAAAVMFALVIVLGNVLDNDVAIGISFAGFMFAVIGAVLCALISWRSRPLLRQLVESAHFVCWRYSEVEWERHLAKSKRGLSMKMMTFYVATGILATCVIGGAIESAYRASVGMSAMNAADVVRFVIPMSIPVGVLLSFGVIYDAVTAWYRRAMQRDGRVAYIGPDALYFAGQIAYAHLRTGWNIESVGRDPRCIMFEHFGYRNHQRFDIPVPEGRDSEARELLEKLRRSWPANNA